jgi:hypothetical protein
LASDATGRDKGDEIGRKLSGALPWNCGSLLPEVTPSTKFLSEIAL